MVKDEGLVLEQNPHIRYIRGRRGYVLWTYNAQELQVDFKTVPAVTVPDQPVQVDRSFVVAAGEPALHEA